MNDISPFIVGIGSTRLSENEVNVLQSMNPLGVILFDRNIESKEQVGDLIENCKFLLNRSADNPFLSLIDCEGCVINRLEKLGYKYPGEKYYGDLINSNKDRAIHELIKNTERMASDLAGFGINANCAPVLDILHDSETAEFLRNRLFGNNIDAIIELGTLLAKTLKVGGIIPVAKHTPGHGRASSNSHEDLPVVDATLEELNNTDFKIFKKFNKNISSIGMVAHIVFSALDKDSPVTQSSKAVTYIKENLFHDILISDAIEMNALSGSIADRAKNVLNSGIDIALYGKGEIGVLSNLLKLKEDYELYLSDDQLAKISHLLHLEKV